MREKYRKFILAVLVAGITGAGSTVQAAAIPVSSFPFTNVITFESFGTGSVSWDDGNTVQGVYITNSVTTATYANPLPPSIGANGSSAFYNLGRSGGSERALGMLPGNATGHAYIGVQYQNLTAASILNIKCNAVLEQWGVRNADPQVIALAYKVTSGNGNNLNSSGWKTLGTVKTPLTGATLPYERNGNKNQFTVLGTAAVEINKGQYITIRVSKQNDSGGDALIGLKSLTLEVTPELLLNGCANVEKSAPCDVVAGSHAAVIPVPQTKFDWWMPRHQDILDRITRDKADILMIGDSITHRWENAGKAVWDKYYASRNAVNLGFGGDRTEHVLWRLQNGEINNIHPKLAVLMIGTNNSGGDQYTPEQIADGINAIVCTLRTKLPDTKVLILSIFPRGDIDQRKDKEHGATYNAQWAKNDKVGELASKMADGKMIFFLDINKAFLNEKGELTRDIMPDLLHPGEKGYQLWADAMEPTIAKLMGEK